MEYSPFYSPDHKKYYRAKRIHSPGIYLSESSTIMVVLYSFASPFSGLENDELSEKTASSWY